MDPIKKNFPGEDKENTIYYMVWDASLYENIELISLIMEHWFIMLILEWAFNNVDEMEEVAVCIMK